MYDCIAVDKIQSGIEDYLEAGEAILPSIIVLAPLENVSFRKYNLLSSTSMYTLSEGSPLNSRKK